MVNYIINLVNKGTYYRSKWYKKCGFQLETQVQITDLPLLSLKYVWLLNLSITADFVTLLTLALSSCLFPCSLSVFLLTVFGLSLCFSYPRHLRRPQASNSTWYHLQHVCRCGGFTGLLRHTRGELFHCSKSISIY